MPSPQERDVNGFIVDPDEECCPECASEREQLIRKSACSAAYGETVECPDPNKQTDAEVCYFKARDLFREGRQCAGWDWIEAGDALLVRSRP